MINDIVLHFFVGILINNLTGQRREVKRIIERFVLQISGVRLET